MRTETVSRVIAAALPAGLALAGLLLGLVIRRIVLPRLARAATRSRSPVHDAVVGALRGHVVVWCTLLGLYLGVDIAELPPALGRVGQRTLVLILILSVSWVVARLVVDLVRAHTPPALGTLPSANLVTNLARVAVLSLGALVALNALGISIAPLLTALGVGGLAVGLALQDTLGNLFAGIHLLLSRQVRPGDFVRLSSGEEGYVQDVTWRYTTILQLANNLTIVPNAKLASTITANFSLPEPEQAVLVEASVDYDSDLRHVERVTIEVGQEVMRKVEGGVPAFTPFIRYHTFGESGVGFTVILRGRDYVSQYLIKHEFIARLHARYRAERIVIPYPVRTVHLHPARAKRRTR